MGRVLTNATGLRCTVESAIGVAGTQWFVVEFESIGAYGAVITTVGRAWARTRMVPKTLSTCTRRIGWPDASKVRSIVRSSRTSARAAGGDSR